MVSALKDWYSTDLPEQLLSARINSNMQLTKLSASLIMSYVLQVWNLFSILSVRSSVCSVFADLVNLREKGDNPNFPDCHLFILL